MTIRYLEFLRRWRWWLLAVLMLVTAILISGIRFLDFTADYRVFFTQNDPYLKRLNTIHETYTKDDTVMFILSPKSGNVFNSEVLEAIEWLTDQAWYIPYVQRVDSLKNFQYTLGRQDELIVRDLYASAGKLSREDIEEIRKIALKEPLLVRRVISKDAKVTGLHVTVRLPGVDEHTEIPSVVKYVRQLAQKFRQRYPKIEVRLSGGVLMSNAFPEASQQDMATLFPLMFTLVFIVLWVLLGSLMAAVWAYMVLLLAIGATMGLAGWMGFEISPPSAAAPNIILTVSVADCVHLLVTFLLVLKQGWLSALGWRQLQFQALAQSLRVNYQPIFLTSLTTVLGFLTLNFSDSPPFRDLGNISAMGVGFAFFYTIVLLPLLAIVVPVRVSLPRYKGSPGISWLADFVIKYRLPLLLGMPVLVIGLSGFAFKNQLNDDLIKYFSPNIQFRSDTEYATKHLTGMYIMEYSLPAPPGSTITDPEYLDALDRFAQWYRDRPETLHVYSIADIIKRLNMNMHGNERAWYKIPQSKDLAAQYLLLYEMSLPEGLELNDRINVNKSASRMTITLKNLSSDEMLALEQDADQWLRENAPAYMHVGAAGTIMFAHIGRSNIRGMLIGTMVAFAVISLTLILAFRSVFWGLLSLVPNLVPAWMAFGLWGVMHGQVSMGLSVVAAMTMGIVVDDTVHFLSKYLHARRQLALSPMGAVHYTFEHVGSAMLITSIVLVAGFLVLTLSDFAINAQMGLLVAITIGFALLTDFFLMPPLILWAERGVQDDKKAYSYLA